MNHVCLVGRLVRTPSVRFEDSGTVQARFTLCIEEPGREGGPPFRLYVPCVAWGKAGEAASLLSAADRIAATGKLCWLKGKDASGTDVSRLAVNIRELTVLASAGVLQDLADRAAG
jgi:single-stranded DNA-binding protein